MRYLVALRMSWPPQTGPSVPAAAGVYACTAVVARTNATNAEACLAALGLHCAQVFEAL